MKPFCQGLSPLFSDNKKAVLIDCLVKNNGAGDGNRTHATSLEGWSSTIELRPHVLCFIPYGKRDGRDYRI
ncbi:hypothetical protein CULT_2640004 [[Clostridium] ultunense Esp]|nr:hypothetical protein CULT_2640004 [[Clostridium] ultunense Esp]